MVPGTPGLPPGPPVPPKTKCSCCGAPGRTIVGCSCRGGKSHKCLRNQVSEDTEPKDIRSMAVALRWRRLASKLAAFSWEFLPMESQDMLDDLELPEQDRRRPRPSP